MELSSDKINFVRKNPSQFLHCSAQAVLEMPFGLTTLTLTSVALLSSNSSSFMCEKTISLGVISWTFSSVVRNHRISGIDAKLSRDFFMSFPFFEDFDLATKRSLAMDACIWLNHQEPRPRLASLSAGSCRWSFKASVSPKPHGNACYAGYSSREQAWHTRSDKVSDLKVAQSSFQYLPRRRFWCVIITIRYQLMLSLLAAG